MYSRGEFPGVLSAQALCWAVDADDMSAIRAVLQQGVDPNAPARGKPPLMHCKSKGNLEIPKIAPGCCCACRRHGLLEFKDTGSPRGGGRPPRSF
jgi:hypothetical protein